MHLHKIKLVQFRVYASATFDFSPGVNLIVGPNAQGKTSILEAIYLLIAAKSFRTHRPSEMIAFGSSGFFVEGAFDREGVDQTLRLYTNGKERGGVYNSTKIPHWNAVIGLLNGAVLNPDDANLIKGPPQLRRQYFDLLIAQADPLYTHHLTRYHRALDQRNALLRRMQTKTIETWETEMAYSAAYLMKKRFEAVVSVGKLLGDIHHQLSGETEEIGLDYKGCLKENGGMGGNDLAMAYIEELRRLRPKELEMGFTLIGPHKDDIEILIDGKDVRSYGSEGQQRTCVGSLKLAEWSFLKNVTGEMPLMLIDDLGISLDCTRQHRLLEYVSQLGQVFLTSTQMVDLPVKSHVIVRT